MSQARCCCATLTLVHRLHRGLPFSANATAGFVPVRCRSDASAFTRQNEWCARPWVWWVPARTPAPPALSFLFFRSQPPLGSPRMRFGGSGLMFGFPYGGGAARRRQGREGVGPLSSASRAPHTHRGRRRPRPLYFALLSGALSVRRGLRGTGVLPCEAHFREPPSFFPKTRAGRPGARGAQAIAGRLRG